MGDEDAMSDNEQTSIDLSVNADAAVETMKELAAAALKADDAFQQLKQHQVELANAIPGNRPVSTYNEAAARFQQMDPSLIRDTYPAVAQTQNAITAQATNVRTQAMDFVGTNPQAAGQPASALLGQFQAFMAQQQQAQQATAGVNYQAPPPPPGQEGLRYGPAVPPEMDRLARYGYDKAQSMDARDAARQQQQATPFGSSGNDTTQQDRTATTMGERFAQALTRSAGGMLSGGISGAANAAGMGATGDLVSGLARPLMAALGDALPLAAGALGVVGGAVGIGLGVNSLQSKYAGERQELAGSVGTTTGATLSSELDAARQAGWAMMYHEADSVAAARQLGMAGVQSGQLGAAVTASGALARVGGIGLDQTSALTGQMMQGGMSANQVGDTYAQMDQAARQSGVSLGRLVEGIKSLNQAAGVGQISVNGLAAAQALAGTSVNFAQASSGTVGSTGTGALAQAALLGLSPTGLEAAQRDPAKLMDSYANLARRYDVGTGGVQVAQQALSSAGFDFSGMKGPQADEFTRRLVAQGPDAAQKYEDSLTKKENAPGAPGPHNFAELTQASVTVAHNITSATDQFKIGVEQAAANLVQATGQIVPSDHPSGHDNVVHAQNTYQAAQELANAQRLHQSPATIAARERALLHSDPNATGTSLSGAPVILNPGAENPALRQPFPPGVGDPFAGDMGAQSIRVHTTHGDAYLKPNIVHGAEAASRKTGVPLAILLAQAAQESGGDPHAVSPDGGYGAYQFTNDAAARKYLHVAPGQDWHGAAYDPKRSAEGAAEMDADLYKNAGGNWQKALASYNGTGPAAQHYGAAVYGNAREVEHRLEVVVHVKDGTTGKTVGQTHTTHTVRTAHPAHSIDTSKKHVGAQSYGPDQRPPSAGLPILPGHVH